MLGVRSIARLRATKFSVLAHQVISAAKRTIRYRIPALFDSKFSLDKIAFLYLMSVPTETFAQPSDERERLQLMAAMRAGD
jgi:hypothetical protein